MPRILLQRYECSGMLVTVRWCLYTVQTSRCETSSNTLSFSQGTLSAETGLSYPQDSRLIHMLSRCLSCLQTKISLHCRCSFLGECYFYTNLFLVISCRRWILKEKRHGGRGARKAQGQKYPNPWQINRTWFCNKNCTRDMGGGGVRIFRINWIPYRLFFPFFQYEFNGEAGLVGTGFCACTAFGSPARHSGPR